MSLKVKAVEREMKVGVYAGTYRYVMLPELYSTLTQEKVIKEAALRSGVSEGMMHACWDAAGEVIKAWATEGHSVPLPGLGTMRYGLSAKTVADVNEVKSSLITTRRIVFTPAIELKDELKNTSVIITCYDRNGNEVKRVTSSDAGTVEDVTAGGTGDAGSSGSSGSSGNSGNSGDTGDTGGTSDPGENGDMN
ncbi:MAG: DNA-binding protein [Prevotella sp.]|nr:DNA-binding protein [Prevotella sp.]